jgi:hypothetical protein
MSMYYLDQILPQIYWFSYHDQYMLMLSIVDHLPDLHHIHLWKYHIDRIRYWTLMEYMNSAQIYEMNSLIEYNNWTCLVVSDWPSSMLSFLDIWTGPIYGCIHHFLFFGECCCIWYTDYSMIILSSASLFEHWIHWIISMNVSEILHITIDDLQCCIWIYLCWQDILSIVAGQFLPHNAANAVQWYMWLYAIVLFALIMYPWSRHWNAWYMFCTCQRFFAICSENIPDNALYLCQNQNILATYLLYADLVDWWPSQHIRYYFLSCWQFHHYLHWIINSHCSVSWIRSHKYSYIYELDSI